MYVVTAPMPTLPRETGWLLIVAYLLGLVMLLTAGIYDGPFAELSLLLVLACAALLAIQFARLFRRRQLTSVPARGTLLIAVIALTVFVAATLADARLLIDTSVSPRLIHITEVAQLFLLGSYLPAILFGKRESHHWIEVRFALFAVCLLAGGMSVLSLSPHPHIDVFTFHTEAAKALLRGENPYLLEMPETGPTKLTLGFVYPPTPAYFTLAGLAIGGDVRWAMLAALLVTGISIRFIARAGVRKVAKGADPSAAQSLPAFAEDVSCLVLWLTPKAYFFIEQSWNDIFPVALVAVSLLAHTHDRRRLSAFFLGLALSAKQTMVLLIPLAILLEFQIVEWAVFLGTAAIMVVPLALWDFAAFNRMVILLQGQLPPRADGLNPMNWLYRHFGLVPRGVTGISLAAVTSGLAAWRAPRTRHAFALSTAVVFFGFYVFNKWTFMNYYFFLTGVASLAAAVAIGQRFERSSSKGPSHVAP